MLKLFLVSFFLFCVIVWIIWISVCYIVNRNSIPCPYCNDVYYTQHGLNEHIYSDHNFNREEIE